MVPITELTVAQFESKLAANSVAPFVMIQAVLPGMLERGGGTICHIDVMDGHFVPNITFGPDVIRAIRPASNRCFDAHLMISPPDAYLEAFAAAGCDRLTVHAEATPHLDRTLQTIGVLGCKAGVALNPGTPETAVAYVLDRIDLVLVMTVNPGFGGQRFIPSQLDKIRRLRSMIGARPITIQADGGITPETAPLVAEAGATALVAGSAVFGKPPYDQAIAALRLAAGVQ